MLEQNVVTLFWNFCPFLIMRDLVKLARIQERRLGSESAFFCRAGGGCQERVLDEKFRSAVGESRISLLIFPPVEVFVVRWLWSCLYPSLWLPLDGTWRIGDGKRLAYSGRLLCRGDCVWW